MTTPTAAEPAAPVTGVPEPAIVIDLGHGRWTIDRGTHAGHEALYFEPAPVPGPFGERAPHFTPLDEVLPGAVCIRFDKPEALTFLRWWLARIADPEGTPDDPAAWAMSAFPGCLPRATGQNAEGGWTLSISLIQEVHREAVRKSGYSGATLEEVEHVMLETERRLAAMVPPAPDDIVALVETYGNAAYWSHQMEDDSTANAAHDALLAAIGRMGGAAVPEWQPIENAPKDGRAVLLLSAAYTDETEWEVIHHAARCDIGHWNPEGTSWVDEFGQTGEGCYDLAVTGVWNSGGGWFQPNEVTHWMPLPSPPSPAPPPPPAGEPVCS